VSTDSFDEARDADRDMSGRKTKHIEICTDPAYDPEGGSALFEQLSFRHRALPEISWEEVKTETEFLGRKVSLPLFISCMTGGSESSYAINKDLARAAQSLGVPVGMGSIRILFRKPEAFTDFHLRPLAPDVPIFSNLGAQQLVEERLRDNYKTLVDWNQRLEVDAQVIHLNPGQEVYQDHGDRDFRGIRDTLEDFITKSRLPVIVKETGFGIAPDEIDWLLKVGAASVDLAGAGGTNWLTVEAYRLEEAGFQSAEALRDWGWPTALLLAAVGHRKGRILASGGLRSGLDLAKALALGAHAGGFALPVVRAAKEGGVPAVAALLSGYARALKTVMILTSSRTLADLRKAPLDFSRDFEFRLKRLKKV
jgi:isopentenyl-diphosphate Delta-isomerase